MSQGFPQARIIDSYAEDQEITGLANQVVNQEPMKQIARGVARSCGMVQEAQILALRRALACLRPGFSRPPRAD